MNFQALTQAARNVFREWRNAIRGHMKLLKISHKVIAATLLERKLEWLLVMPFVGALLAVVFGIGIMCEEYPPRSGNLYEVLNVFSIMLMIAGMVMYDVLWMISIDDALEHRRHQTYTANR